MLLINKMLMYFLINIIFLLVNPLLTIKKLFLSYIQIIEKNMSAINFTLLNT